MAKAAAFVCGFFLLFTGAAVYAASGTGTTGVTIEVTGCVGEGTCSTGGTVANAEAAAAAAASKAEEAKQDAVNYQAIAEAAPDEASAKVAAESAEASVERAAIYERLAEVEATAAGSTTAQTFASAATQSLTEAQTAATAARYAADNFTPAVPTTETTTTTVTNTTGTSSALPSTEGGGVTDATEAVEVAGETTFRPAPETPVPAPVSAASTSTAAPQVQAETRLPQGARTVGNLLGGSSSIGVAGLPNQTFVVSLPGKTVYSGSGGNVVAIDSFVHNAGFTPALNTAGSGVFVMGANIGSVPGGGNAVGPRVTAGTGSAATAQSTPTAGGPAGPVGPRVDAAGSSASPGGGYTGPVISVSPFLVITISYN